MDFVKTSKTLEEAELAFNNFSQGKGFTESREAHIQDPFIKALYLRKKDNSTVLLTMLKKSACGSWSVDSYGHDELPEGYNAPWPENTNNN